MAAAFLISISPYCIILWQVVEFFTSPFSVFSLGSMAKLIIKKIADIIVIVKTD